MKEESNANKMGKMLLILIGIAIVIGALIIIIGTPVTAVDVYGVSFNNTIRWNWSETTASNITLDGIEVENFKSNGTFYQKTFQDSKPITHTLIVYSSGVVLGTNITSTTTEDKTGLMSDALYVYFWLILSLVCCFIGAAIHRDEPYLIGGLLAFVGIGANYPEFMPTIIYALDAGACFYLSFKE